LKKKAISNNLIRCFICIELPREVIDYIQELSDLIKKQNLFNGKFTEIENLHFTLKFLGEIEEEKIKIIQESLRKIKIQPFFVNLGELGFFSKKVLRILWMKIYGKGIFDLQEQIDGKMEKLAFLKEERFMSHLTIARIKKVL
jgi:2'-5' RNA ligase